MNHLPLISKGNIPFQWPPSSLAVTLRTHHRAGLLLLPSSVELIWHILVRIKDRTATTGTNGMSKVVPCELPSWIILPTIHSPMGHIKYYSTVIFTVSGSRCFPLLLDAVSTLSTATASIRM